MNSNQTIPEINKEKSSDNAKRLLVVRFANGEWSHGGHPKEYSEYDEAEFYWVWYEPPFTPSKAVKKAQAWRSRQRKKYA